MAGASQSVWSRLSTHAVVGLCVFALLAGTLETAAALGATELGNQISSSRRGQSYFESAMLSADVAVVGIKSQMHITKRALKQASRTIKRSKRAHWNSTGIVQQRSAHLAELEAMQAGTPPEQIPPWFAERLRNARREVARAKAHRQAVGRQFRAAIRARSARQYRLNVLKRSLRSAVSRRESAEGGLGAYIVQLTRLAAQRAEIQSNAQLSISSQGFTWPSVGRIAQTYGCTGFYLNPRRGSCRHFHDGLDIVSGYGSRVHSAADGVVAYAGWNPWDEGGRAWIMVVSHPDGYVTRYGHLIPGSIARVGQFVRQGQAIGKMGNTGKSLGTHLHFELLRGSSPLNPFAYLPAGMVTIKPAKDSGRHGKGKHGRGGKGARGKDRAGQRRAGSQAARDASAAAAGAPSGQVFEVDLASIPFIPGATELPASVCPAGSDGTGAKRGEPADGRGARGGRPYAGKVHAGARGGQVHAGARGGQGHAAARAGGKATAAVRGGKADSYAKGRRDARAVKATKGDLRCLRPSDLTPAASRASLGSGPAADSAGATVRGWSKPRVPDTASAIGQDRGVPISRRGTSPSPT